MVPPLAGILRMPVVRFLAIDGAASMAWSIASVAAGVVYGQRVLPHVVRAQRAIGLLGAAALVGFIAWKLYERRWLVRHYSVARVAADELRQLLLTKDPDVIVIDLRSEQAFSRSAIMIEGARRIPPGAFEGHIDTLPIDKEIVLYCT